MLQAVCYPVRPEIPTEQTTAFHSPRADLETCLLFHGPGYRGQHALSTSRKTTKTSMVPASSTGNTVLTILLTYYCAEPDTILKCHVHWILHAKPTGAPTVPIPGRLTEMQKVCNHHGKAVRSYGPGHRNTDVENWMLHCCSLKISFLLVPPQIQAFCLPVCGNDLRQE